MVSDGLIISIGLTDGVSEGWVEHMQEGYSNIFWIVGCIHKVWLMYFRKVELKVYKKNSLIFDGRMSYWFSGGSIESECLTNRLIEGWFDFLQEFFFHVFFLIVGLIQAVWLIGFQKVEFIVNNMISMVVWWED